MEDDEENFLRLKIRVRRSEKPAPIEPDFPEETQHAEPPTTVPANVTEVPPPPVQDAGSNQPQAPVVPANLPHQNQFGKKRNEVTKRKNRPSSAHPKGTNEQAFPEKKPRAQPSGDETPDKQQAPPGRGKSAVQGTFRQQQRGGPRHEGVTKEPRRSTSESRTASAGCKSINPTVPPGRGPGGGTARISPVDELRGPNGETLKKIHAGDLKLAHVENNPRTSSLSTVKNERPERRTQSDHSRSDQLSPLPPQTVRTQSEDGAHLSTRTEGLESSWVGRLPEEGGVCDDTGEPTAIATSCAGR